MESGTFATEQRVAVLRGRTPPATERKLKATNDIGDAGLGFGIWVILFIGWLVCGKSTQTKITWGKRTITEKMTSSDWPVCR